MSYTLHILPIRHVLHMQQSCGLKATCTTDLITLMTSKVFVTLITEKNTKL